MGRVLLCGRQHREAFGVRYLPAAVQGLIQSVDRFGIINMAGDERMFPKAEYRVDHDYELFGELGRKIPA